MDAINTNARQDCICHKFIRLHDGNCPVHGFVRKTLSLNLEDSGQNFAGVATIRAAIFDALDNEQEYYELYLSETADEELVNVYRGEFVDAVIARIAELQHPPHEGVKLENLCDKHKRECLPAPTARVCRMCEAERKGQ